MSTTEIELPGQRGPAQHEMREKILLAAYARFRHYGSDKTTIGDIAKDLKVSPAYLYKFFDSKLALNEAVAASLLDRIDAAIWKIALSKASAAHRLRGVYRTLLNESLASFFNDQKLLDLVVTAIENDWCAIARHTEALESVVRHVVSTGRASGEFETTSSEDAVVGAIYSTMVPFGHPVVLQHAIHSDQRSHADAVADLVLKGLKA